MGGSSQSKLEKALGEEFPDGERYFGFSNFGNTCFCNSVLQVLYALQPLRARVMHYMDTLEESGKTQDKEHNNLLLRLAEVFSAVCTNKKRTGCFGPRAFVRQLWAENVLFEEYQQQDAHEFFNFLINDVIEILQREAAPPGQQFDRSRHTWVHELFGGTSTNEVKCLSCENVTSRTEKFLDLSVDVEENCSVSSCLKNFSKNETMGGQDKFYCEKCCCKQEAQRRSRIKEAPPILSIHLKRFKYFESQGQGYFKKLGHRVVFPFELRLRNYAAEVVDTEALYTLVGVVVHRGRSLNSGHYISYIKSRGNWLEYDDDHVTLVSEEVVRSTFGSPTGSALSTGYLLFYMDETRFY